MHGTVHLFEQLRHVDAPAGPADGTASATMRSKPLVGLIRNARSHRNERSKAGTDLPDNVIGTAPHQRRELRGILADFAEKRVDCIAIDGGDGTVRDVVTSGAGIFGDSWPPLVVLPNGKTNALAIDLGIPTGWTLDKAMEAIAGCKTVRRAPIVVSERDAPDMQVRGFILGAGIFNRCIALGQRSHDLGAFNAAAVGVTTGWSVLQAFFGGADNPWRQGSRMRIADASGAELDHLGGLPPDERFLLLASTLENFPAGLDPYRGVDGPIKLAVLDNARRGLLLRIGALARGTRSAATLRRGAHVLGGEAFDVDLADSFILDGEAFPPGNYRLTMGAKLRFVVP